MSLFDDFNHFLEERLDEFLRSHPHLELQALDEQLREQAADVRKLLAELKGKERDLENRILDTAREVQLWHERIKKAKAAKRFDLVPPAEEREAALLRQGNQLWGVMRGVKDRIAQAEALQQQIEQRHQEVQAKVKAAQAKAAQTPPSSSDAWSTGWNRTTPYPPSREFDPLEKQFQEWETDEEIQNLKRQMGR